MLFCPFCGTDNAVDQRFCRNCGAQLPTTTAKPTGKSQPAGTPPSSRPGTPFIPPQPPNVPRANQPVITNEIKPRAEAGKADPYATQVASAYKSKENGLDSTSTADLTGDGEDDGIIDSFYETQVAFSQPKPLSPDEAKAKVPPKSATPPDTGTIKMGSLKSVESEPPAEAVPSSSQSEEYFPTIITPQAPSREEQLRMLKEMMESSEPSAAAPLSPPSPERTLAMTAVPSTEDSTDDQANAKTGELVTPPGIPSLSSTAEFSSTADLSTKPSAPPFDQTMPAGSLPQPYNQTLVGGSPPSEEAINEYIAKKKAPEKAPEPAAEPLPKTIAMEALPRPSDTGKQAPSWNPNATNPYGKALPELSADKTEKFASISENTAGQNNEDQFKTITVPQAPPRAQQLQQLQQIQQAEIDPFKTSLATPIYTGKEAESEKKAVEPVTSPVAAAPVTTSNAAPITTGNVGGTTIPPTQMMPAPFVYGEPTEEEQPKAQRSLAKPLAIAATTAIIFVVVSIIIGWKVYQYITKPVVQPPKPVEVKNPPPTKSEQPVNNPTPKPELPANMALVPAGEYKIGCNQGELGCDDVFSTPARKVRLNAFYIDIYEVTNQDYAKFIQETGRKPPKGWRGAEFPGDANSPVINVSWEDAKAYAEWAGKRLPTEEEWEVAAGGREHLLYSWGNDQLSDRANTKEKGADALIAVGSLAAGKSPFGTFDMCGNVWEWTDSPAQPYPGSTEKLDVEPDKYRVFRGGSYKDTLKYSTTVYRNYESVKYTSPVLGFRCAKDISLPQ